MTLRAGEWFELNEGSWSNFNEFRACFLGYFWSESRQYAHSVDLNSKTYEHNKNSSMSSYFLQQITQYRTFVPPLSDAIIFAEIMRQFPISIQNLWSTISNSSVSVALEFLEKQDNIKPVISKAIEKKQININSNQSFEHKRKNS